MAMKRKNDTIAGPESGKKVRLSEEMQSVTENAQDDDAMIQTDSQNNRIEDNTAERRVETDPETSKAGPSRNKIRKLAPTRPWPVVPTSVSATGPRSAHKEGKNMICISRKTNLGAYMRRCKDVILKDGYKVLHLSAMGAAIPLLLQLACSLPPILPHEDVKTEITTGTCEVRDEVLPDDEDEDISIRERSKSTLLVVITIGNGKFEGDTTGPVKRTGKGGGKGGKQVGGGKGKSKASDSAPLELIYAEPDQDDLMDAV